MEQAGWLFSTIPRNTRRTVNYLSWSGSTNTETITSNGRWMQSEVVTQRKQRWGLPRFLA